MSSILIWLVLLEVLGWAAFSLVFSLFPGLPDRGYAFAKTLGLLILGYVSWLAAMFQFVDFGRGTLVFFLIVFVAAAALVARKQWQSLRAFVSDRRRLIFGYELLFIAAFAGLVWFRGFNADIAGTEKPMDMALMNGILRSSRFPPADPWMSGFSISYYYFGYYLLAVLVRLTGVAPTVGFNLGLATMFSLAGLGIAGAVYGLTRRFGAALLGVFLALLASNPDGLLRVLSYGTLAPQKFWWWWDSSRVLKTGCGGQCIDEFPQFSFMLGDLHPHVMALPFAALALGLGVAMLKRPVALRFTRAEWPTLLLVPLAVGSLGFINTWDLPAYLALVVGCVVARQYVGAREDVVAAVAPALVEVGEAVDEAPPLSFLNSAPRKKAIGPVPFVVARSRAAYGAAVSSSSRASVALDPHPNPVPDGEGINTVDDSRDLQIVRPVVSVFDVLRRMDWRVPGWMVLLAVVGYLPFYVGFHSQAGGFALVKEQTTPDEFWRMWAFLGFLALAGVALLVRLRQREMVAFIVLAAALEVVYRHWLVAAAVPLGLAVLWSLWRYLQREEWEAEKVFVMGLLALAFGLLAVCEAVYLKDTFNNRMNTIFKFYYEVWLLLSVGGAVIVDLAARQVRGIPLQFAWRGIVGLLCVGAAVYPVASFYTKADELKPTWTLDGMTFLQASDQSDWAAINWLNQNVSGDAVIAEATGDEYSSFGRFGTFTGLESVLGWAGHELQWRGEWVEQPKRIDALTRLYTSVDPNEIGNLLAQYNVSFVVAGPLERQKYGNRDYSQFQKFGSVAFQSQGTTIYRITAGPTDGPRPVGVTNATNP